MSDLVCYIPSYNDSDWVAESLSSCIGWDVVISDNASDEPHRSNLAAMAGPGVQVIRQPRSLGRVGNWKFCIDHFLTTSRSWCKLLCAGDTHKPDAASILSRAIQRHPQVRFIVSEVDIVWPDHTDRFRPMGQEVTLLPEQTLAATVEFGNIYFGLLAVLVHRDAVSDGFVFGEDVLSFCADLMFCVSIAKKTPTLYLPEATADFIAARRKTLQQQMGSLPSTLEDALVRFRAVDACKELGVGDVQLQAMRAKVLANLARDVQHFTQLEQS